MGLQVVMIVIQYITMQLFICKMKAQDRNMCTESYLEKSCDKCIMSKNELRLELCLTPFVGDMVDIWSPQ